MTITHQSKLVEILKAEGITNEKVLDAFLKIARHEFVEKPLDIAYANSAMGIDCQQTISQPYVVAKMTELLLEGRHLHHVLEIGTGSGFQAAILSQIADKVDTVERQALLFQKACKRLQAYKNVQVHFQDGFEGLKQKAPFDGVMITAFVETFPKALFAQMADDSVAVFPEGNATQRLVKLTIQQGDIHKTYHDYVKFVPMCVGKVDKP